MAEYFRKEEDRSYRLDSADLDENRLQALTDETRREMLSILSENPSYPAEISEELGISKQRAYYHFEKLEDAGLIVPGKSEKRSGGTATFYRPSHDAFVYDLGEGGSRVFIGDPTEKVEEFLSPMLVEGELEGRIVVGSPDQHGEDQVRAKDGHLAGEIGLKLGSYGSSSSIEVRFDTEIVRDQGFDSNLLILGGVLTNTIAKKFNDSFPVRFSTEDFPYHEIRTSGSSYSDGSIGFIARTENPENLDKVMIIVAGIGNRGTEAAVRAFKNLEEIIEDYEGGDFYRVVRGLDLDGDGEIDDYEVVE